MSTRCGFYLQAEGFQDYLGELLPVLALFTFRLLLSTQRPWHVLGTADTGGLGGESFSPCVRYMRIRGEGAGRGGAGRGGVGWGGNGSGNAGEAASVFNPASPSFLN